MDTTDLSEIVTEMRKDTVIDLVDRFLPPKAYAEQWDIEGLDERVKSLLGLELPLKEWAAEEGIANEEFVQRITAASDARAADRIAAIGEDYMRQVEKNFLLQMVDMQWREHLMHLDHLRNVIGLRGYGQRDPLNEYKTEAFSLFETLLVDLRQNVTRWLMTVEFHFDEPAPEPVPPGGLIEVHMDPETGQNERGTFNPSAGGIPDNISPEERQALPMSALPVGWENSSRNAPCPCGSGKKFKHCHGALV
jgi:preprotein translocase subunit SecA